MVLVELENLTPMHIPYTIYIISLPNHFFICSDIILGTELHELKNFAIVDPGVEQWSTHISSILLFVNYN